MSKKSKGQFALAEPSTSAPAESEDWALKNIEASLDEDQRLLREAKERLLVKLEEYRGAERKTREALIAFGAALYDVRDDLFSKDDDFKGWVEANLNISREYAYEFINAFRVDDKLKGNKPSTASHYPPLVPLLNFRPDLVEPTFEALLKEHGENLTAKLIRDKVDEILGKDEATGGRSSGKTTVTRNMTGGEITHKGKGKHGTNISKGSASGSAAVQDADEGEDTPRREVFGRFRLTIMMKRPKDEAMVEALDKLDCILEVKDEDWSDEGDGICGVEVGRDIALDIDDIITNLQEFERANRNLLGEYTWRDTEVMPLD